MTAKYTIDLSRDEAEAVKTALDDWIAAKETEDTDEEFRQTFIEPLRRVDEQVSRVLDSSEDQQIDIRPNRRFR